MTPKDKSFHAFLIDKAASYGHQCPQCGGNDGFFAIKGKCNLCKAPILRYGQELTLLFSLEAFLGFIDHHVTKGSAFDNQEFKELVQEMIRGLKETIPKLIKTDLTRIQELFRSGIEIGEINGLYTIILNRDQTETVFPGEPFAGMSKDDFEGFVGALLAIQYITVVKFR